MPIKIMEELPIYSFSLIVIVIIISVFAYLLIVDKRTKAFYLQVFLAAIKKLGQKAIVLVITLVFCVFLVIIGCEKLNPIVGPAGCWVLLALLVATVAASVIFIIRRR